MTGIEIDDESVVLRDLGDYVVFGPGQAHRWQALGEATMLTVRWAVGNGAPAGFRPWAVVQR
ncbi:hypothetical protein AB0878_36850 [Amycolatopsis sp. NPDC047767]|uniref:hypothetical protein n=1 Tax=Amycolatopsis sp. NPDC047767 TaxID=3156765 RepID=UPI0034559FCE